MAVRHTPVKCQATSSVFAMPVSVAGKADVEVWNKEARSSRLAHLEAQALKALEHTLEAYERPAFPCALIAGDVVRPSLVLQVHMILSKVASFLAILAQGYPGLVA